MFKTFFILSLTLIFAGCASKKEEVPIGLYVGNKAPLFSGKTPNDSLILLSSFEGSLILVDFWASWCGPCRVENKNLTKTVVSFSNTKFPGRKKRHSIGLKVLNVSLDNNKKSWLNAIEQDKLTWPFHISDLKGWGNEIGKLYRVNSIPSNFLIDAKGIIIARNLRGEKLDLFLEEYKIED